MLTGLIFSASVVVSIIVFFTQLGAYADPIPKGWQASNMKVIATEADIGGPSHEQQFIQ
jgi:hypothetical protein